MASKLNIDSSLVDKIGGAGKALKAVGNIGFDLGTIKQQSADRTKEENRYKGKMDLLEAKKTQDAKDRASKVSAFRKIHPKTTAGLTDDEVYQLGDNINKLHTDKTPMKFKESFTADNGDRIGIFYDGSVDANNNPVYKNVVLGKAKDYQGGKGKNAKDFGYGFNADGTPMTAQDFGENQAKNRAKKRKASFDLENTEIK